MKTIQGGDFEQDRRLIEGYRQANAAIAELRRIRRELKKVTR